MRTEQLEQWMRRVCQQPDASLQLISGDASFRRYFRYQQHGTSLIAVDAPSDKEDNPRFIAVLKAYQAAQIPVPHLHFCDLEQGFMALEDLGDQQLLSLLTPESVTDYYHAALALLPQIASVTETEQGLLPRFDRAHIATENSLFRDWLLGVHLELKLSETELSMLEQAFELLSDNALQQPQVGVHRDYHSRNLMVVDNQQLGVIDFQDAVLGPITYDVASLLRDCYVGWPDSLVDSCLQTWMQFAQAAGQLPANCSWQQVKRWFDLSGIQRHVKASGIFARLNHRDGKAGYLQDIPRTLRYIIDVAANYDELAAFAEFVELRVLTALEAKL